VGIEGVCKGMGVECASVRASGVGVGVEGACKGMSMTIVTCRRGYGQKRCQGRG
jgi:hypothetical protein